MKRYWIAAIVNEDGEQYAYGIPVRENENIVSKVKGATAANICPTKKAMYDLVQYWNDCFRENKTYMFTGEW